MNLALWIVQAVLALIFLGAGTVKLVQSRDRLVKKLGGWVEDVLSRADQGRPHGPCYRPLPIAVSRVRRRRSVRRPR